MHIIILEKRNPSLESRIARRAIDLLEQLLAGHVGGMRLAGEHELDRARAVGENSNQPLDVVKDEIRTLVRREAPREPDRQDVGIEKDA